MRRAQFPDDKPKEAPRGNNGKPTQPFGGKPILLLALVQDDLQRAEPDRQKREAGEIDLLYFRMLDVRRVLDEGLRHQRSEDSHRQIDIKNPAPRIVVRNPAAERRPQD